MGKQIGYHASISRVFTQVFTLFIGTKNIGFTSPPMSVLYIKMKCLSRQPAYKLAILSQAGFFTCGMLL
jgi:hypothetical protein